MVKEGKDFVEKNMRKLRKTQMLIKIAKWEKSWENLLNQRSMLVQASIYREPQ